MSALTLSPRDRRVLALGAATIGLLFALGRGVPALRRWEREQRAEAAELAAEAARARGSVRAHGVVRDSLKARETRFLALAPLLLGGETPAVAGATLASLVSGAAAACSVRLGAVQVRADSAGQGVFTRVAVRADAVGDVRGVTGFLAALERGPALLAVRELSVSQSEPAAPPDRPEVLRIELTVEGLVLSPRAAPAHSPRADSTARGRAP